MAEADLVVQANLTEVVAQEVQEVLYQSEALIPVSAWQH